MKNKKEIKVKKDKRERIFLAAVITPVFVAVLALLIPIVHVASLYFCDFMPYVKKKENSGLDTTQEKQLNYSAYQVVDGKLYYKTDDFDDPIFEYDYATKKERKLVKEAWGGDFIVLDHVLYYSGHEEDMVLLAMKLSGDEKKPEIVLDSVGDYIFSGTDLYYNEEDSDVIYRTSLLKPEEREEIVRVGKDESGYLKRELLCCLEDVLVFRQENRFFSFSLSGGEWRELFQIESLSQPYYFEIDSVVCLREHLYVKGRVCNSEKNIHDEGYEIEDADENGVWEIDIAQGSSRQIDQRKFYDFKVFHDGLYGVTSYGLFHWLFRYEKIV